MIQKEEQLKRKFENDLLKCKDLSKSDAKNIVDVLNANFLLVGLSAWVGKCNEPTNLEAILNAELRLGISLPSSTKKFYLETNGISSYAENCPFLICGIESLLRGSESDEKASEKIKKIQKLYGQKIGSNICIARINTYEDVYKLAIGGVNNFISLDQVDSLLILSSRPKKNQVVGLCVENFSELKAGNVVSIEGSKGRIHENLKEWLSSFYL